VLRPIQLRTGKYNSLEVVVAWEGVAIGTSYSDDGLGEILVCEASCPKVSSSCRLNKNNPPDKLTKKTRKLSSLSCRKSAPPLIALPS